MKKYYAQIINLETGNQFEIGAYSQKELQDTLTEINRTGFEDLEKCSILVYYEQMEDYIMLDAQEIIDSGLYDAAVNLMDGDLREEIHADLAPCSDLEFLEAYMERHLQKYGAEFEI